MAGAFNWWMFALFVSYACFMPGPNNITSMAMARSYGMSQSAKYAAGSMLGFAALNFVCCLFSGFVARVMPPAKPVLAVLGALYMLYLAYTMLKSKPAEEGVPSAKKAGVLTGFLFQFINPQGIVFALSIASIYVTPYFNRPLSYAMLALGMGVIAFLMICLWGFFGLAVAKFFKKYNMAVNIVMALLLGYCAYTVFVGMFAA